MNLQCLKNGDLRLVSAHDSGSRRRCRWSLKKKLDKVVLDLKKLKKRNTDLEIALEDTKIFNFGFNPLYVKSSGNLKPLPLSPKIISLVLSMFN